MEQLQDMYALLAIGKSPSGRKVGESSEPAAPTAEPTVAGGNTAPEHFLLTPRKEALTLFPAMKQDLSLIHI